MVDTLPLVSIITPSFNSGEFLEQAIQSVVTQAYPHLEYLIMDGGSTDNTLSILRRYGPPVVWISEPDKGQADALNKGFRRAQGEIIGWLNADDTYHPNAIVSAVAHLQARPEVDLIYGHFNFMDAAGQIIHSHITPEFSLKRLLSGDAVIPQTSMFFRRRILDEIGGVEAGLHYVMDWEFTLRIARRYQVKRVNETWSNFRITAHTKSVQQPEKFWPEVVEVLQQIKFDASSPLSQWLPEALFMAHLRGGLEFARVGQLNAARQQFAQAFGPDERLPYHPAVLASGLHQAASQPWHNAFRLHPLAQPALDNLSQCLVDSPAQRQVLGYVYLYRAMRSLRALNWRQGQQHLAQAAHLLTGQYLFDWRTARMVLGAILK